jgi:hypothetical protein
MQGFAAPPSHCSCNSFSFTDSTLWPQASHGPPQRRWSRKKVRLPDDPEPRLLVYGSGSGVCYFSCRPRKPNCPPLIRWQDLAVTRQTRCHLAALHLHPLRHGRFAHQPGSRSCPDATTTGARYARLFSFSSRGIPDGLQYSRRLWSAPLLPPPLSPSPSRRRALTTSSRFYARCMGPASSGAGDNAHGQPRR